MCKATEERDTIALGHNYETEWTVDKAATCTEEGSKSHHCTRCGNKNDVTAIAATGHRFGEWTTTKNATCTEAGKETKTCSICETTEEREIVATGHSYSNEWTVDQIPTCTQKGSKSHHCLRCFDKADVTEIPANGHSYGDWYETQVPTCTTTGTDEHECSVCHNKETRTVGALGHDYQTIWKSDETNHWKECACGDKSEQAQHSWNDGETTKEATVEAEGIKTYTCTICSQTKTESIAKLPQQSDTPETPSASDEGKETEGLSGGAIAGIVVGSTGVVGTGGFSLFWFVIKKKSWAELLAFFKK